jgi:hypothetical protein
VAARIAALMVVVAREEQVEIIMEKGVVVA